MNTEKVIAKFLEDFAREEDKDNYIAPNLSRLPRTDNSWQGFLHDAAKLKHLLNLSLFQRHTFKLHSGNISDFKIECDALTDDDIETLAYLISKRVEFKDVIGIPNGGIRLEQALKKYKSDSDYYLIVDDVLTTGNSMEKAKAELYSSGISTVKGVVIFARNICPYWVMPVFQMWGG